MGETYTYAYNPAFNNWTLLAPMPTPRNNFAEAAYGGKIYVIGGWTGGSESACGINEVYDPATNFWTTAAPMPTARGEMNAAVAYGRIYVMGGRTAAAYSTVNVTEAYDPTNDSWSTAAQMPYPVVAYASAVVDDKIYVIGGQDEWYGYHGMIGLGTPAPAPESYPDINLRYTQIYNPANDSWSFGAPVPGLVFGSAAGTTTGVYAPTRIYVLGGVGGSFEASNQNLVYDPAENSWGSAAALPNATSGEVVAVVNDVLYVIGGGTGQVYLGNNWQFTPIGYAPPVTQTVPPSQLSTAEDEQGKETAPKSVTLEIAATGLVGISIAVVAAISLSRQKKKN